MGGCKMVWRHSESHCYWMNPEIDQMRMKVHEAEMRVGKLIKHINEYHDYMSREEIALALKGVWNIGRAKVGIGYAEIEYI